MPGARPVPLPSAGISPARASTAPPWVHRPGMHQARPDRPQSSSDLFSEPGEGKRAGAEVDDIPVI